MRRLSASNDDTQIRLVSLVGDRLTGTRYSLRNSGAAKNAKRLKTIFPASSIGAVDILCCCCCCSYVVYTNILYIQIHIKVYADECSCEQIFSKCTKESTVMPPIGIQSILTNTFSVHQNITHTHTHTPSRHRRHSVSPSITTPPPIQYHTTPHILLFSFGKCRLHDLLFLYFGYCFGPKV